MNKDDYPLFTFRQSNAQTRLSLELIESFQSVEVKFIMKIFVLAIFALVKKGPLSAL